MSFHQFACGKCCAGDLCCYEHHQLRPEHTCTTCGKIVHILCGIGGREEDTFVCLLCYNANNNISKFGSSCNEKNNESIGTKKN